MAVLPCPRLVGFWSQCIDLLHYATVEFWSRLVHSNTGILCYRHEGSCRGNFHICPWSSLCWKWYHWSCISVPLLSRSCRHRGSECAEDGCAVLSNKKMAPCMCVQQQSEELQCCHISQTAEWRKLPHQSERTSGANVTAYERSGRAWQRVRQHRQLMMMTVGKWKIRDDATMCEDKK